MAQQRYSFPILKLQEIKDCMDELHIDVRIEDLREPKAELIKRVYEQFVHILMGTSREEMRHPMLAAAEKLPFAELHEDSIPELGMNRAILRLLRAVGISDATMRDYFAPDPQRTKRILSALINFAKFREERLAVYQELAAQTEQLVEMKQQLEHSNAQFNATVTELQQKRQQEAPVMEALERDVATLRVDIDQLNKQHTAEREDAAKLKGRLQDVGDTVTTDKFALLNMRQENDRLRTQIVRSPEKIKRSIADMGAAAETGKREIAEQTTQLRELQSRAAGLTRVNHKLNQRLKNMNEIEELLRTSKELVRQIKTQGTSIADEEENFQSAKQTELGLRKQISAGQDKLVRLQQQFEHKRHAAQMALDQVNAQRLAATRAHAKERGLVEQNDALVAQKKQQMQAMAASHGAEVTSLRRQYEQLGMDVKEYHDRLLRALSA